MKRILFIISMLVFSGNLMAQTSFGPWILIQEQNNVKISRSYSSCDGEIKVLLKIENNNTSQVSVKFDSAFNLNGSVFNTDHSKQITIPALTTVGGNCADQNLSVNPYNYVTTIQMGVSDYIIQNLTTTF